MKHATRLRAEQAPLAAFVLIIACVWALVKSPSQHSTVRRAKRLLLIVYVPAAAVVYWVTIAHLLWFVLATDHDVWTTPDGRALVTVRRRDGDWWAASAAALRPGRAQARPLLVALCRQADRAGITVRGRAANETVFTNVYEPLDFVIEKPGRRPTVRRDPQPVVEDVDDYPLARVRALKSADLRLPSLDVVEHTLTRQEDSYRARASALDAKAGLVLTGAGVLIPLVGLHPGRVAWIAQLLAAIAAVYAVSGLYPRIDKGIDIAGVRDRWLQTDPIITRMVLLSTRIDLQERNEGRLTDKARWVQFSAWMLFAAVAILLLAVTLNVF